MAATFARILGTERDRLNCPFYFRIGACRHGDRCSRNHLKPHFSQTVMIPHMYQPSTALPSIPTSEAAASPSYFDRMPDEAEFTDFFEDVLDELVDFGRVDDMLVVQNLGEHMHGNCYVKFHTEEEAAEALKGVQGRYYKGRLLQPEYSPVSDFSEAVCGMFRAGFCERGEFCNFMHSRPLTRDLRRRLREAGEKRRDRGKRSRGDSPRRGGKSPRREGNGEEQGGAEEEEEEWESPEARRARIAAWNAERERAATAAAGGAGAAAEMRNPPAHGSS